MWIEIGDKLFNMNKVKSICKYGETDIVFHYEDEEKDCYIDFITQYCRDGFYRGLKKALEITASREFTR